jgi:hypothetical protein
MEMLECIIVFIRLRTHKMKKTRHLILVTVKIGYQMDSIDLEDERCQDTNPIAIRITISRLPL